MRILALVLVTFFVVPGEAASAPSFWVSTSYETVFKDATQPQGSPKDITMLVGANEAESAQISLRHTSSFDITSITSTALNRTGGGGSIDGANMLTHIIEYHAYSTNSPGLTTKSRTAPADYPDAISNDETKNGVAANTTQGIWVTLVIPKTTVPGEYVGSIQIATSAGDISLSVTATVLDVVLPDPVDGIPNVPMLAGQYSSGDEVVATFGDARYSPNWWKEMGSLIDNMVANRTNWLYIVWYELLRDGGTVVAADGKIAWDWSTFDEFVQFGLDRGLQAVLSEGVAFIDHGPGIVYVITLERDAGGNTVISEQLAGSAKANAFLNAYLPALKAHLDSKGWTDIFYTQIADETGVYDRSEWVQIANLFPSGVKILDTSFILGGMSSYIGLMDIWVPWISAYETSQASRDFFAARQQDGDMVFSYSFGESAFGNVNRLIDGPAWMPRMIMWYNRLRGFDGYLHWGYNWFRSNNTWRGDAYITYADTANKTIKTSIRESNQRDGMEEWELMKIIDATDPSGKIVGNILASVITDQNSYTTDINVMRAAREKLLRYAALVQSACP